MGPKQVFMLFLYRRRISKEAWDLTMHQYFYFSTQLYEEILIVIGGRQVGYIYTFPTTAHVHTCGKKYEVLSTSVQIAFRQVICLYSSIATRTL